MKYEIRPFALIARQEWDDLVATSDDAWLYHTTRAIEWHCLPEAISNHSFGVFDQAGRLCAAMPLYLISTDDQRFRVYNFCVRVANYVANRAFSKRPFSRRKVTFLASDPEVFAGPIFRNEFSTKSRARLLRSILGHIDSAAERFKADRLEIRLSEPAANLQPVARPPVNPMWLAGVGQPYTYPPRLTAFVDLSGSTDVIWKQLDEDCRAAINKARRSGIEFVASDRKNVERFHAIHAVSWDRTLGHHQPLDRFANMFKFLDAEDNVHCLFSVLGSRDLAAVLIHTHKGAAFYFSGGSHEDAKLTSANNFLLYQAMLWAKDRGCGTFVVGIFDAHCVDKKSFTVGQYKAQFSSTHLPTFEAIKRYR
jgi:hypothetical protein